MQSWQWQEPYEIIINYQQGWLFHEFAPWPWCFLWNANASLNTVSLKSLETLFMQQCLCWTTAVKGWSLWNQMALQCQPLHLWYCLTTIDYIQLQQIWCPQCQMRHPIHDISFSSMSRITYFIPNTSNKSISIMLACFNQIEGQLHTHTCTCGRSPATKHTQSWNVMNVIINFGPPRLHRFTGCQRKWSSSAKLHWFNSGRICQNNGPTKNQYLTC